nr:immunoglobulin heavy chain junction region [Mus musculus]MBK4198620.1 immunoglobulin heavy chain junction region [Mus musculus]
CAILYSNYALFDYW